MSACRAASGADPAIPRAPYRVLSCLCALLLAATAQSAACAQPGRAAKPEAAARNATPAQLKPFTIEDLVRLKRLSDPRISPDGRYVAFVLRETDIEANRGRTDVWLLDLTQKSAAPRRLTQSEANDSSPRWAPDSRTLYFLSARSGSSQVWRLSLSGGEAERVTDYPLDVDALKVSPTGNYIAISMAVLPECADLRCTKDKLAAREKGKATGQVFDRLFVRHWDTWSDGTRSHLFSARINADGKADAPLDLSRPLDADVPSKPFGGDEEFVFSPDGSRIVFSARIAGRTEPWSTNFDLFEVPVDRTAQPQNLTQNNPAWDTQPVFLRNGDLAWLAQERPGFESDRFHIVLKDAHSGAVRPLTQSWDRSVIHLGSTPDGRKLLATAEDRGQTALFWVDPTKGTPHRIVATGEVSDYAATNDSVVFAWANLGAPADLYKVAADGDTPQRLTQVNAELLGRRRMSEFEQYSFKGWNDETVYGYVMKPYGFASGQHYPIAFLVHGGPQGSMQNIWHYRWNAQAFAGAGYAVVMIDFHGSTGYGQAFTDSISRDWGGKPLLDLQKGLAAALERYPWLDGGRACALGGSYGGFMMNWIEGNWPDGFRCIVNHDGVFDQRMMYYSTDELWFAEWENGGPQYENPQDYEQFNPVNSVARWHTPMLIVHGERDFRIPYTQGIAAFTALQRRGIESRLLLFPDENHWVLKPANSVMWYHETLGWLDAHLKK
ncbi:MAG TPA: S9 family peptidase [Steroidobacteraceae bacterium]|nr:S9 family peptidase [Steroidobacteraceae bacterium]